MFGTLGDVDELTTGLHERGASGQRALWKLTPVEYELAFTTQAADVAA